MGDFNLKTRIENGDMRLDSIPILYVRGTHYVVGFTIGRTFKFMITELLEKWDAFNNTLLPMYSTADGKTLYEDMLTRCKNKFPNYVKEIEGMAVGCQLPFHKLFLLNIESIMTANCPKVGDRDGKGCTSIIVNKEEKILGHSEDADKEILNHVYIVHAEIFDEDNEELQLEEFTSFSYAGHLMGYTMGYNSRGMIHSVNTIFPKVFTSGTPRNFIARALLNVSTLEDTLEILRDVGTGISDGFSLNIYLDKDDAKFYNIEVGPPEPGSNSESQLDVMPIPNGTSTTHSNKYQRIKTTESDGPLRCSTQREESVGKQGCPSCISSVQGLLSDQSSADYPIFIGEGMKTNIDFIRTVAVGIFDIGKKTWSIFLNRPVSSNPVAVLQMNF